ncbi:MULTISPECIES: hypothetical protein [Anaerococcus]|uniref:hypothetical protein n=1 Tax=Anaerococcus TaxID=165779 RepID=UPI00243152FE|nr:MULTISPECIES: hypothetical protein [Anaerococcus]MDD7767091.1 hypothetical protein [Anaerococcus vaginalis]MDY6127368.1 hypothetical protein [Anaerococcus sp.]
MLEDKLIRILEDYEKKGDFDEMSYLDLYIDKNLFIEIDFEEFIDFVKTRKLNTKNKNSNISVGSLYI